MLHWFYSDFQLLKSVDNKMLEEDIKRFKCNTNLMVSLENNFWLRFISTLLFVFAQSDTEITCKPNNKSLKLTCSNNIKGLV